MATHLIEAVQENLGYPALKKVDPVNHEPKDEGTVSTAERLGQAAIPAVLAALFKLSQTEAGSEFILNPKTDENLLSVLYKDKASEAVDKVAHYAGLPSAEVEGPMTRIAEESMRVTKEMAGQAATPATIKSFMGNERHHILVYLPAAMQLGNLLEDNTLDDRTNKMEGPISSFMHKIENKMSGSDS